MRILLLAPHPFFEGRGTPIREKGIIEALVEEGHEVDVLAYAEGQDPEVRNCRVFRVPAPPGVRDVPPGISWKKLICDAYMIGAVRRRLRGRSYDLVHAVEESVFIARAVGGPDLPYVYDMHSSLSEQLCDSLPALRPLRRLFDAAEATAVRGAAGVLTVCPALEDRARRAGPDRIVGCAEDASLLPPDLDGLDRPTDLPEGSGGVVLYVGNMHSYQGTELLVRGFARVVRSGRAADLVLVGGSEDGIERHRALADELGVGPQVHLLGPRPPERLGHYLLHADVVVSPRIGGTNTPMKIYSYLDSGTALLATRLETHTQVLDDEVAVLVEPTPEGIAEGLDRLLSDALLSERIGRSGRRLARSEYSREAFHRKVREFYRRVEQGLADASSRAERRMA